MERIYSIRHLGLFSRLLLRVTDEGFYYKNKFYTLNDVEAVNVTSGFSQPQRLGVRIKGRKIMIINAGHLELNVKKARKGFFYGNNYIFEGLKSYFMGAKA